MTCRSFLMLVFLVFLVPHAVAVDTEEWRAFERAVDYHPEQAFKDVLFELQLALQRGDKHGQLNAIRKLARATDTLTYRERYLQVHHLGVALAGELHDDESHGWFLFTKATIEMSARNDAEAAKLLQRATTIAIRNGFASLHAYILLYNLGAVNESDTVARVTKAYTLFESAQDKRGMAKALGLMGYIYQFDDDLRIEEDGWKQVRKEAMKKVIEYESRALTLIDPEIHLNLAGPAHYRLGIAYTRLDDYRRAKEHFEEAISIGKTYKNRAWMALPMVYLANVFKLEKSYEEALVQVEAALPLLSGQSFEFEALYLRAQLLAYLGRKQESLEALPKAEAQLSPSRRSLRRYRAYYFETATTYALLGDYQQAYLKMSKLLEPRLSNGRFNDKKIADELKVRFDVQLKETENALLRSQQQQADSRRIVLMLALALSLLLPGAVCFHLRRRTAAATVEAAHHRALAAAEVAANEAKRTFLANMSHELRSPLNVVLGFTQLLMNRTDLPHDARQDLTAIYNSGQYLYTLINQVLDLSKIETGNLTLNETDFDLYALMDELADMFILPAKQKGLHLLIENDPNVPQYLHADALKLRQVLINLLNNAIKFTSEGSIALNVGLGSGRDSGVSFAVSDTGPGVAPDELEKLGGAFVQAQAGRVAQEGTGLGLAISANFLQLMDGGPLKYSSKLGEGMTIAFDLPAKTSQSATAPVTSTQLRVVGLAPGQPRYRILVTDDRVESRKLLARLLTPLGFEVREAGNGKTALDIWDEWSPHLVWMDMRMPVIDGREATRRIRATEKGKGTVIIALTASSFGDQRRQILDYGCNEFLPKPFREGELFDMMHKHLGVEFVYKGTSGTTDTQAVPDTISVADLPTELREQLRQALKELDVEAVEASIAQVRTHDSTLGATLEKMAYRYEYVQMRELVAGDTTAQ